MVATRLANYGVGVTFINGSGIWCLWVRETTGFRVRMSLDDFDALGIYEYQQVRLGLPGEPERERPLYLRCRYERPPFVWLELAGDVLR